MKQNFLVIHKGFLNWVNAHFNFSGGEIIAINGKTLRCSYDTTINRPVVHMVNA